MTINPFRRLLCYFGFCTYPSFSQHGYSTGPHSFCIHCRHPLNPILPNNLPPSTYPLDSDAEFIRGWVGFEKVLGVLEKLEERGEIDLLELGVRVQPEMEQGFMVMIRALGVDVHARSVVLGLVKVQELGLRVIAERLVRGDLGGVPERVVREVRKWAGIRGVI